MSDNKEFLYKIEYLVDKNVNFLFGSGASAEYIPTLRINEHDSYETILTDKKLESFQNFIYWHYYKQIISRTFCTFPEEDFEQEKYNKTFESYCNFIQELVDFLNRRSANQIKRANIFTTNYDLFFEKAADKLQEKNKFNLNDGSLGLIERYLNISNFHISCWHQGTHDQYRYELPTINLIKLHGSVSWIKENDNTIKITYPTILPDNLNKEIDNDISLKDVLNAYESYGIDSLSEFVGLSKQDKTDLSNFFECYKKLALVNPTKKKFEETVFQQHYYQALRLLSYELEKPQTVLVCFGFSFKDEHITEIIKRSLTNPTLKIFIFCYKQSTKDEIKSVIDDSRITYFCPNNQKFKINFTEFYNYIFQLYESKDIVCTNS